MVYEKVMRILEEKGADAVLVKNPHTMRYITGYQGDTGCAYISKKKRILFTDFRYIYQAEKEAAGYEIVDIQQDGYSASICAQAADEGIHVLLFEGSEMTYAEYCAYQEKFGHAGIQMAGIGEELSELRIVKTPYEIAQIRQAEQIGDLAFSKILADIRPGVTELAIAAKLEYIMKTSGAQDISFPAIVASGIHSSMPHAVPTSRAFETGDFVTMDFGCKYNGYCSDMTRTVVIGRASDRQREIYDTVLQAQMAVLQELKAGKRGCDIDKIARDLIYGAGYEGCFGHGLGHGVGLNIHESPRASVKYEKIIEENMTLTVEPGIYIQDFGGVRIEDLVLVTKDGHINFTGSPKELIEL